MKQTGFFSLFKVAKFWPFRGEPNLYRKFQQIIQDFCHCFLGKRIHQSSKQLNTLF
jgi:5-formyltetrahydrofolate cyclo-ligase